MPHDASFPDGDRDALLPPDRASHVRVTPERPPEADCAPITERVPPRRLDAQTLRTMPTDPLPPPPASGPVSVPHLREDPTWQSSIVTLRKLRHELERAHRGSLDPAAPEDQVRTASFLVLDHLFYMLDEFARRAIRREPYRLLVNENGRRANGVSIEIVIAREEPG